MLWVLRVLQLMSAAARECCGSWVLRITGACCCGCVTLLQLLVVPVGLAVPGIPRGSPFWVRMRPCWKALGKGRRRSEGPEDRGRQNVSHFIVFPLAGFAKAPGGTLSGTHSSRAAPWHRGEREGAGEGAVGCRTRRVACPWGCPPPQLTPSPPPTAGSGISFPRARRDGAPICGPAQPPASDPGIAPGWLVPGDTSLGGRRPCALVRQRHRDPGVCADKRVSGLSPTVSSRVASLGQPHPGPGCVPLGCNGTCVPLHSEFLDDAPG